MVNVKREWHFAETPAQRLQHLRQRTIEPSHAKAVEQRLCFESTAQHVNANTGICLVDDAFRYRQMVVGDAANFAVEIKILKLQNESAANFVVVYSEKKLLIDFAMVDFG